MLHPPTGLADERRTSLPHHCLYLTHTPTPQIYTSEMLPELHAMGVLMDLMLYNPPSQYTDLVKSATPQLRAQAAAFNDQLVGFPLTLYSPVMYTRRDVRRRYNLTAPNASRHCKGSRGLLCVRAGKQARSVSLLEACCSIPYCACALLGCRPGRS